MGRILRGGNRRCSPSRNFEPCVVLKRDCTSGLPKNSVRSLERKHKTKESGNKKEIGRSSRIDDEVIQDKRQRDDNDLQDERQDQPKEEEVEPRRCKGARTEK
ncbi:hypothetical protein Tco_1182324, partial [Tanacetum coccineum]